MTILIGGNFASGGLDRFTVQTVDGKLANRIGLAKLGDATVMRATVSHRDYVDSASLRSELSAPTALAIWGREHRAHWRFVVPQNWVTYAGEADTVVIQLHEMNIAAVSRRPALAGAIRGGLFSVVLAHDDAPSGDTLVSMPIVPGQEVTVSVRAKWADGTAVPVQSGYLDLMINGALVASRSGRNHWATVDTNPPYLKCGAYVPVGTDPWWAGKSRTMFHVGAVMADGGESFADLDRLVSTQTAGLSPQRLRR